jgi:[citrate (pro-3S)-lyase] ligase
MCYESVDEREISLRQEKEAAIVRGFLAQSGMALDAAAEYTIALYWHDRMIATGSLAGDRLCSIAVDPEFRGEGLAAKVVSNLIQEAGRRGHVRYFIHADLETAYIFSLLGFSEIAREASGVLLAMGLNSSVSAVKFQSKCPP